MLAMLRAVGTASVPLILAIALALGYQLDPAVVEQNVTAIIMVLGLVGTVIAGLFPSIAAKLKFGKDAK